MNKLIHKQLEMFSFLSWFGSGVALFLGIYLSQIGYPTLAFVFICTGGIYFCKLMIDYIIDLCNDLSR